MTDKDWDNYERVRAMLEPWCSIGGSSVQRPPRMTPADVACLRRRCLAAGGVEPADYERPSETSSELFRDKLKRLSKLGGEDLLVPESPALGGFGHEFGGRLYNLETLKHIEVLIGLRRGGLLDEMKRAADSRLIVQVGPTWGGLAYQLKTVCKQATCVLADQLGNLLLAAVYLMNRFPDASFAFAAPDKPAVDWHGNDFIFVRQDLLPRMNSLSAHLLISVLGFEVMGTAELQSVVDWAHDTRCPFVYSLDTYCAEAPDVPVAAVLERGYWPHEIPVLPVSFDRMLAGVVRGKSIRARAARAAQARPRYRHVIGWRRYGK